MNIFKGVVGFIDKGKEYREVVIYHNKIERTIIKVENDNQI